MPNWRPASIPRTSGSCSAPASGSATSPPRASSPRIWRSTPRARRCDHAGIDAQSIDLIVLATSTPDNTFPATAVAVQHGLGINHGAAFDLQAVCSGFVFALATADNFLRTRRLQARAGDRRRDLFADSGLERPRHLRAVRRRRRRGRAGGADAAGQIERPRRADDAFAFRRPAQVEALRRRRSVLDPDRRPICGWKAARCSSTRSA